NAGAAWQHADDAQRNELGRALFEEISVRDGELDGFRARIEFQPYLLLAENNNAPSPTDEEAECQPEVRRGGLEGIRTPDLQRDRLAC
ncbi:MAG: hypothetical protein QOF51_1041, partial [Chloroflexota bacterium]|nr:hypothetical protein [Chloroflexota bacterium]